jgi:hypothetical protein
VVRPGDTLSAIAQRELGDASRWVEITKDPEGRHRFSSEEARRLRINQSVYLPVTYQAGPGTPITPPNPGGSSNIRWVNFSGRVGPKIGVNLRHSTRHGDRSSRNEPYNKTLAFDAWTHGETITDIWLGTPDSRWFKVKGTNLWVPSAYIWGNPPSSSPLPNDGETPKLPPLIRTGGGSLSDYLKARESSLEHIEYKRELMLSIQKDSQVISKWIQETEYKIGKLRKEIAVILKDPFWIFNPAKIRKVVQGKDELKVLGRSRDIGYGQLKVNSDALALVSQEIDQLKQDLKDVEAKLALANIFAVEEKKGVTLYRWGSSDYLQVVNLKKGASVKLIGKITGDGGKAAYGGDNPTFKLQDIDDAWNSFQNNYIGRSFSITNSQFFSSSSRELAFPVKQNGSLIDGYAGRSEFENEQVMLEIGDSYARIKQFDHTSGSLRSASKNLIAGLSYKANKVPSNPDGRTFVGVGDWDEDNQNEILVILTSKSSKQYSQKEGENGAFEKLQEFGANPVVMLDGGGSSQLRTGSKRYVESSRFVPHFLGVVSG